MKALIITITTLCAFNAYAVSVVGWERPINESAMSVKLGKGQYTGVTMATVVMTKKDSSEHVTGVQVFLNENYKMSFQVLKVEETACGSQKLVTQYIPVANQPVSVSIGYYTEMVFIDHSFSLCNEVQSGYTWEVQIIGYDSVSSVPVGELVLAGQPHPIYTVQQSVSSL